MHSLCTVLAVERNAPAGTRQFGWALACVASATLVIIPKLTAYNQPLLIPALLVLLAHREETGKARLFSRALAKAPLVCLFGQWATAVILSLCSLLIPASQLQPAAGALEYTLLAPPPVTMVAVAVTTLTCFFRRCDQSNGTCQFAYSTNPCRTA
jgi:hypothetical protein